MKTLGFRRIIRRQCAQGNVMNVRELLDVVRSTLFQLNLKAYEDLLASLENSEEKGCRQINGSTM
jgi:hypothetical protein